MTEDQLQAACFQWAWNNYPELHYCMWHVPNGKRRTRVEAAQLQAMGVIPGVWDVHIYYTNQLHIVEFKVGANDLTAGQVRFGQRVGEQGARRLIIHDAKDAPKWCAYIKDNVLHLDPADARAGRVLILTAPTGPKDDSSTKLGAKS